MPIKNWSAALTLSVALLAGAGAARAHYQQADTYFKLDEYAEKHIRDLEAAQGERRVHDQLLDRDGWHRHRRHHLPATANLNHFRART